LLIVGRPNAFGRWKFRGAMIHLRGRGRSTAGSEAQGRPGNGEPIDTALGYALSRTGPSFHFPNSSVHAGGFGLAGTASRSIAGRANLRGFLLLKWWVERPPLRRSAFPGLQRVQLTFRKRREADQRLVRGRADTAPKGRGPGSRHRMKLGGGPGRPRTHLILPPA